MQSALASVERNSEAGRRTVYLCHLASAYASLGQPDVSLGMLDEAFQRVEASGERVFEAELYRVQGKIL